MLEISELKAKKLPELQELANTLKVPKYRTLKKLDLSPIISEIDIDKITHNQNIL